MKTYLIIVFVLVFAGDVFLSIRKGDKTYNLHETLDNIGVGLVSLLFDHFFSLLSLPLLFWLFNHFAVSVWERNVWYFIALFVFVDFVEYWFHRLSHIIPLMWTAHKVHHQGEHFNLSNGLRTSLLIPFFNISFYCVIPLLGFDPLDIVAVIFTQGIFQLFVHTEKIGKLGILDKVLVTPSVHRVHHGINEKYIDKNFGKMLVLWDILFGTYEKETERVNFGVTDPENEKGIFGAQLMPVKKWWLKRKQNRI